MLDERDVRFACALFDVAGRGGGNLFLSPASVRTSLALLYLGARGLTAEEMARAAGFGAPADTSAAFARTWRELATPGEPEPPATAPAWARDLWESRRVLLHVVSRVWGARGRALLEEFARGAAEAFAAPLERLDFAGDAEGSRRAINAWVEQATERKIVDLLGPGEVDPQTKLVVTNAAYFMGRWSSPFEPAATHDAPFFAPGGAVVAPLMHLTEHFAYAERAGVQIAELPYGGGDVTMRVAVPREAGGLPGLERRAEELLAAPLEVAKLHLSLPRFRVESRLELADVLAGLGMPSLFRDSDADLSGVDGTRELYVSRVVHQAFVATDEHGTEAAAATAMALFAAGIPPPEPIVDMRVDRPFLFWIVHPRSGVVLFSGRVVDPSR